MNIAVWMARRSRPVFASLNCLVLVVLAPVLAHAASPAPAPATGMEAKTPQPPAAGGSGGAGEPRLNRLTPLTSPMQTAGTEPDVRYSNSYTRLLVLSRGSRRNLNQTSDSCGLVNEQIKNEREPVESKADFVPYNDRSWFLRAFDGRRYAVNYSVSVSIGDFRATVPLATLDHVSDSKIGEKVGRVINHSAQNFPLILIKSDGSNAIASLKSEVRVSDQLTGSSTATAIQAASDLVTLISPQAKVLTSLSSQTTKNAASGLESAISSLMQKSISENQTFDNDVRRWGREGVCLRFYLPKSESDLPRTQDDLQMIGAWQVVFERPRPSIFSDVQICPPSDEKVAATSCGSDFAKAATAAQGAATAHPAQVLAFELIQGQKDVGTVASYLQQQPWWTKSIQDLTASSGKDKEQGVVVGSFCRSIKSSIAGLQLNDVDAGIVVAAVRDGLSLPSGVADKMKADKSCALAYPI